MYDGIEEVDYASLLSVEIEETDDLGAGGGNGATGTAEEDNGSARKGAFEEKKDGACG